MSKFFAGFPWVKEDIRWGECCMGVLIAMFISILLLGAYSIWKLWL